jgi:Rieske Fe-S protein
MADWPDRLDRFVAALRANRRPERRLARSPEELDDLRMAARLAGARAGDAEPDPAFLADLREQLRPASRPTRRQFWRLGLLGLASAWAAGIGSAFGLEWVWNRVSTPGRPTPAAPAPVGSWYPVATLATLPVGALRTAAPAGVPVFLRRDQQSVRVLSRVCTHQGCLLLPDSEETGFVCPCHGAVFDSEGRLVPGYYQQTLPPLPAFETRIVNGIVYVRV